MSNFKIACQTITWGENQRNMLPKVFEEVASAGFAGVEIGFRHIRQTPPSHLAEMLDKQGLVFTASHIGGNLFDAQQAGHERAVLDEVLDYLEAMGSNLLMYSGLPYESDQQLATDIDMLSRAAENAHSRGISLLYHNHDFEFAKDGLAMHALLNDTVPTLGFCPDIGWLMKSKANVIEFLDARKDRIGAMHFKDFATSEQKVDTVVLGEGIAPLDGAADWIKRNKTDLWIIAEQDTTSIPPNEAAIKNAEYLRRVLA